MNILLFLAICNLNLVLIKAIKPCSALSAVNVSEVINF